MLGTKINIYLSNVCVSFLLLLSMIQRQTVFGTPVQTLRLPPSVAAYLPAEEEKITVYSAAITA